MDFLILAAGEGSRLKKDGVETPKPLVPINGCPMILRLIRIFAGCFNYTRIHIIVNEEMTEVRAFLEELRLWGRFNLDIVVESTPSSMHSLYSLVKRLPEDGKFVATTVDTIFSEEEFRQYMDCFCQSEPSTCLMGLTDYIDDEKPLYVEMDADGRITAFSDRDTGTKYISGGIYGLPSRESLKILKESIESGQSRMRNFQRALLSNGLDVEGYVFSKIIDVDHPSDIVKAEALDREFRTNEGCN